MNSPRNRDQNPRFHLVDTPDKLHYIPSMTPLNCCLTSGIVCARAVENVPTLPLKIGDNSKNTLSKVGNWTWI